MENQKLVKIGFCSYRARHALYGLSGVLPKEGAALVEGATFWPGEVPTKMPGDCTCLTTRVFHRPKFEALQSSKPPALHINLGFFNRVQLIHHELD